MMLMVDTCGSDAEGWLACQGIVTVDMLRLISPWRCGTNNEIASGVKHMSFIFDIIIFSIYMYLFERNFK